MCVYLINTLTAMSQFQLVCVGKKKMFFLHLSIKKKCLINETVPFTKSSLQARPRLRALNYCLITTQIALKIPRCTVNKSALAP